MRNFDAWVASVEVNIHVVHRPAGSRQVVEIFLGLEIGNRDHVDGRDNLAIMVVGQEWARWERLGVDIELPEAGEKIRQLDQLANLLEGSGRWRLINGLGREGGTGDCKAECYSCEVDFIT